MQTLTFDMLFIACTLGFSVPLTHILFNKVSFGDTIPFQLQYENSKLQNDNTIANFNLRKAPLQFYSVFSY